MQLFRAPLFYINWALLVALALPLSYKTDPYIFGLATLGLAWATGAIALTGLFLVVLSRDSRPRSKALVAGALVLASAAVAIALRLLGGFKWA